MILPRTHITYKNFTEYSLYSYTVHLQSLRFRAFYMIHKFVFLIIKMYIDGKLITALFLFLYSYSYGKKKKTNSFSTQKYVIKIIVGTNEIYTPFQNILHI